VVSLLELSLTKKLRDFALSIELELKNGQVLIMTGMNGSGKTTTLNIIAGLTTPDSGYIRLDNKILFDGTKQIEVPVEERQIGYIFQNAVVFPYLSVYENIAFGLRARRLDRALIKKKIDALLNILQITQFKDIKAGHLSGGQKQLVIFARALAIDPAVLLLDEPFRALDQDAKERANRLIYDEVQSRNIPCIIVTHNIEEVLMPETSVCRLDQGRIIDLDLPVIESSTRRLKSTTSM
jgi:molybdate transport system ATP-binding protein